VHIIGGRLAAQGPAQLEVLHGDALVTNYVESFAKCPWICRGSAGADGYRTAAAWSYPFGVWRSRGWHDAGLSYRRMIMSERIAPFGDSEIR
jgi:hypothetical protein